MSEKQRVALLDFDGTTFRWSLFLFFIDELVRLGALRISSELQARVSDALKNWDERIHVDSYLEYLNVWIRAVNEEGLFEGISLADTERAAENIVAKNGRSLNMFTRELIAALRECGYFIAAVSFSPDVVVRAAAKALGLDHAHGYRYEVTDGKLNGMRFAESKATTAKHYIERFGHEGSIAVGDTYGDMDMMRLVDFPLAMNPCGRLFRQARERGIACVVERKDRAYVFDPVRLDDDGSGCIYEVEEEIPVISRTLPSDVREALNIRLRKWYEPLENPPRS